MTVRVLCALGLLSIFSCAVQASQIQGSFSIGGSIVVSETMISWLDDVNVSDKYVVGPPSPTNTWATMPLGSEGDEQTLDLTSQPVGGTFPAFTFPNWMDFPGPGPQSTITITLEYIFAGTQGTAECGLAAAPNQTCTPLAGNLKPGPFNLSNSASGTTSSATFTFEGIAHDNSGTFSDSKIIGQYSADFTTPYQSVLTQLAAHGSVTNTYAATWVTVAGPVPEPSTLSFLGIGCGLFFVAGVFRHYSSRS